MNVLAKLMLCLVLPNLCQQFSSIIIINNLPPIAQFWVCCFLNETKYTYMDYAFFKALFGRGFPSIFIPYENEKSFKMTINRKLDEMTPKLFWKHHVNYPFFYFPVLTWISESGAFQSLIALFSLKRMVRDAVVWMFRVLSHICVKPSHQLELPEPPMAGCPGPPRQHSLSSKLLSKPWAGLRATCPLWSLKKESVVRCHVWKGIPGVNRKCAQRKVTVTSPALWSGGGVLCQGNQRQLHSMFTNIAGQDGWEKKDFIFFFFLVPS